MAAIKLGNPLELDELDGLIAANIKFRGEAAPGTVVIKPNFAGGSYVSSTSHAVTGLPLLSKLIAALCRLFPDATLYIAEGDSTGHGFAYKKFEHLGLPESLELSPEAAARVRLLDLTRDRLERVDLKTFRYYSSDDRQLWLSETLMQADLVVSITNLKCHTITRFTGACKNLYGCLPDFDKSVYHPWVEDIVHDLALAVAPGLNIVDGTRAMEGNGPIAGEEVDAGFFALAESPWDVDRLAAMSIGVDPRRVRHLAALGETLNLPSDLEQRLVREFAPPERFVRVMNGVGLSVQGLGTALQNYGHRLHVCTDLVSVLIATARPALVKCIDINTLRKWRRRWLPDE